MDALNYSPISTDLPSNNANQNVKKINIKKILFISISVLFLIIIATFYILFNRQKKSTLNATKTVSESNITQPVFEKINSTESIDKEKYLTQENFLDFTTASGKKQYSVNYPAKYMLDVKANGFEASYQDKDNNTNYLIDVSAGPFTYNSTVKSALDAFNERIEADAVISDIEHLLKVSYSIDNAKAKFGKITEIGKNKLKGYYYEFKGDSVGRMYFGLVDEDIIFFVVIAASSQEDWEKESTQKMFNRVIDSIAFD